MAPGSNLDGRSTTESQISSIYNGLSLSHSTTWMKTIQRLNTKFQKTQQIIEPPRTFWFASQHQSMDFYLFFLSLSFFLHGTDTRNLNYIRRTNTNSSRTIKAMYNGTVSSKVFSHTINQHDFPWRTLLLLPFLFSEAGLEVPC